MGTTEITKLGLTVIEDFITEAEEQTLLSYINPTAPRQTQNRNSIRRFGTRECYDNYMVSEVIPTYLAELSQKLIDKGLVPSVPLSVSLNEYNVGQKINAHIDSKESGEIISVISLKGHAVMKFEKYDEKFFVDLPPRSLIQMQGAARWNWSHGILPLKEVRYSIVFRSADKHG